MRFICANRDTVALIEDGARFSDFLVDWAATPIRFWWNSFARKVLEHACATVLPGFCRGALICGVTP
jgi:hypothetical protein